MPYSLLITLIFASGCLTNPTSASRPPLARFGGTVTTTGTGTLGCELPIVEVMPGVDLEISWTNLTEDFDGNPVTPPTDDASVQLYNIALEGGSLEELCASGELFGLQFSFGAFGNEDGTEAILPSYGLPGEGEAGFLSLAGGEGPIRQLLLITSATSTNSVVEFE